MTSVSGFDARSMWAFAGRVHCSAVALGRAAAVQELAGGIAWSLGAAAAERLIGVVQALYVARLLGIEDFGKYGLVFLTIGLLSSLVGLQLGLTAAVEVSRSRLDKPERAASVIRFCEVMSLGLGGLSFVLIAAFPDAAAHLLLGDTAYADIIVIGSAIAVLSVIAGIQEGVLQGFEQFRNLAVLRAGSAILSLALLLALARAGDLSSVVLALLLGVVLRTAMLILVKEIASRACGLGASFRSIWQVRNVIFSFSVPAVLATLVGGIPIWSGFWLVSQLPNGFSNVAVLTAGQQWRGLVFYLTAISAGVAIPMMSRLAATGDVGGIHQIHRVSLWANVGATVVFVGGIWVAAGNVLSLYGTDFVSGRLIFCAMVTTTVPMVFANVYFQYLVSQRRMWEQLSYYLLQAVALTAGYLLIIGEHSAIGFVLWTLFVGIGLCLLLAWRVRIIGSPSSAGGDGIG